MKAITVIPKQPGTAQLEDIPEPDIGEGSVLVEAIAVGVCGTDTEIVLACEDRPWLVKPLTRSESPENFAQA